MLEYPELVPAKPQRRQKLSYPILSDLLNYTLNSQFVNIAFLLHRAFSKSRWETRPACTRTLAPDLLNKSWHRPLGARTGVVRTRFLAKGGVVRLAVSMSDVPLRLSCVLYSFQPCRKIVTNATRETGKLVP